MKSETSLCFGILISIFYFGVRIDATTKTVQDTNDFNNEKFELLLKRLEHVERRNDEMERRMEMMAADFREKEKALNDRIAELEKLNEKLRNYENDNHVTDERFDNALDDSDNVTDETNGRDAVKKQTRTIRSGSRLARSAQSEVAFFATVTQHDVYNLGVNQNIVFDHAVTNTGNAFHNIHGIFTAPVAGTYVLCATVAGLSVSNDQTYYAHFDVNGKYVAKFITHPYRQATQMIILKLQAGDDVSVKNTRAEYGILGAMYTSFSGFLLYQDFGSSVNIVGK
ncbi:uncharacterized protein LOC132735938 [Ruditapes philippinarum]|uniref:uncharacterized protein LOC132735938 n=1 Tax=Ruditapes philippinarum TaxID=129788 RepID=UPI00295A6DA0|nr:uncharacterized protein LOC132735938 [Ruditapes philippinarum]